MATKAKSTWQTMVMTIVAKMIRKLKKDHPTMKQSEIMKKAWKTKEVMDARKKYDEYKAKKTKKGACDTAKTGGAAKKRKAPAKKRVAKKK